MVKIFSTVNTESDREEVKLYLKNNGTLPIIFPWSWYYKLWWGVTVFAALFALFLETYQIAFSPGGYELSTRSAGAILEFILVGVFGLDIVVNFNLAYYDKDDQIVFARRDIAWNYARKMFWVDMIGVFPFYIVSLHVSGQVGESTQTTQYLALLRLFKMIWLHRVPAFFSIIKYSSKVSFMSLTIIRNLSVVLVWTHIWACIMFFIARQRQFDEDTTWLGSDIDALNGFERYITSLYWSVVTFTTVGYGDFSPVNSVEQIFGMVYMILNIMLMAWVIGSITLLVVKTDQKTGLYRETLHVLYKYASIHDFDKDLTKRLRTQLKLDFENQEIADEQVLQFFPAGVRRKVLRRLYLPSLLNTKLMKGTRQQFVDAFLSLCKVEIFSPGDELLQRGSISSDLYLLLDGNLEVAKANQDKYVRDAEDRDFETSVAPTSMADDSELHSSGSMLGRRRTIRRGEFINEIGFFTESPQENSIRVKTVSKVLTMSRSDYRDIAVDHPGSAGRVLANLLAKVEELPQSIAILHSSSRFDWRDSEADIAQAEVHVQVSRNHLIHCFLCC